MFRHRIYQKLGQNKAEFLKRVRERAKSVGMPEAWRGTIGLTGSNSARPAYLRPDVIAEMSRGARSPRNLVEYLEEIRLIVKRGYGDDYDALPIATCEAALWMSLDVLAAPPLGGRGDNYRARYLALYEAHGEHQIGYGRPFPPRYKDLFADRANIGGEMGVLGRRLNNLDVIIVPVEGARYEAHGIKQFIVPLLTSSNTRRTEARLRATLERHVETASALVSLGYDSPGYGYREKLADGVTPALKAAMGRVARDFDLPYIVDNARALPFLGAHPRDLGAGLMLFSMDKVAGAPTSGLIVGRPEYLIPLQRAMGWHSERFAGGLTYGKGVYSPFDPGREALVGQVAALRWLAGNKPRVKRMLDGLFAILREEARPLVRRYGKGIVLSKSYNGGAVELNYVDTWKGREPGIPIFSTEDKAASMNFIIAGLAEFGILPPGPDEGNVVVTFGRGLVDERGDLEADKARIAIRAMVVVLQVLGEMAEEYARG